MEKRYSANVPQFLTQELMKIFCSEKQNCNWENITYADMFDIISNLCKKEISIFREDDSKWTYSINVINEQGKLFDWWEEAAIAALTDVVKWYRNPDGENCENIHIEDCDNDPIPDDDPPINGETLVEIEDDDYVEDNERNISASFFGEDVLITDPCYFIKGADWNYICDAMPDSKLVQKKLSEIGINGFAVGTKYGDWSCTVYKTNLVDSAVERIKNGEDDALTKELKSCGQFCADSGTVCVVSLPDVVRYSRENAENFMGPNCKIATIVRGFFGRATVLDIKDKECKDFNLVYRHLVLKDISGNGPGYVTIQTGC